MMLNMHMTDKCEIDVVQERDGMYDAVDVQATDNAQEGQFAHDITIDRLVTE